MTLLADGAEQFIYARPRGGSYTVTFDDAVRYCTGWHDLAAGENFPCPDHAELPSAYEQCRHCQRKTGFNPAFYNAQTVSPQQEARNLEPHSLYIAHFGPGVLKVGITWAGRGIRRLLDQGARSGLVIKTFPTANVARRYEALTAKLPGIAETLQVKVKSSLLQQPYDSQLAHQELLGAQQRLVNELGLSPDGNQPLHLDPYYLSDNQLTPGELVNMSDKQSASGLCLGMIGGTMVFEQEGLQYLFPLSHRGGYRLTVTDQLAVNQHAPHQVSLF